MSDHRPCALVPHLPLTRGQVKLIEADLLQILSLEGIDTGIALIAQSTYLRLLARFLDEARAESRIGFDADPEANDPFLDHFRRQMANPASGRAWDRLLHTAAKPADARRLRRVILASVLAAIVTPASRPGMITRSLRSLLAPGRVDFGPPLGRIPFRQLVAVDLSLNSPATQLRVRQHTIECIGAESLLAFDDLQFSHAVLLIGFGLSHWLAAAHALHASRSETDAADWDAGFEFTGRALGPHSDFPARLDGDPTLRTILQTLTARPLFPYAMARP